MCQVCSAYRRRRPHQGVWERTIFRARPLDHLQNLPRDRSRQRATAALLLLARMWQPLRQQKEEAGVVESNTAHHKTTSSSLLKFSRQLGMMRPSRYTHMYVYHMKDAAAAGRCCRTVRGDKPTLATLVWPTVSPQAQRAKIPSTCTFVMDSHLGHIGSKQQRL
jgi:hypothetical protein